jgi:gamma-glutamyl-gamma-aminobutyrate hydrolase PuuD
MTLDPPLRLTRSGKERRIGVELELSGLELDQIADLVQETLGGRIVKTSRYEALVEETEIGTIRVEFDARVFREMKVRNFFEEVDEERFLSETDREQLETALATMAGWLIPYELVFPPIELSQLPLLEKLRARLGENAQGTGSSVINAFGLHLNTEVPNTDVATVLAYLRAFLVLYDELKQAHDIDPIRNLSGFISPFPRGYQALVLDESYRPDMTTFINDYLKVNATRNRPLDLLPLMLFIDPQRVRAKLPDEKISARPALHYRMPNCMIDDPSWSISREWAAWLKVEHLVSVPDELRRRCRYKRTQLQGRFIHWLRRLWRTKPVWTRKPLIAVTGPDHGGFPAWACTALAVYRSGGYPVRLTPRMFRYDPSLPPFDGLVLGGGADIDPGRYGEEIQAFFTENTEQIDPKKSLARRILAKLVAPFLFVWRGLFSLTASKVDRERDAFEQSCLKKALRESLPVLGICRGAQFLNTHLGGTLYDDLSSFYVEEDKVSSVLPRTRVKLEQDSYLRFLFGSDVLHVNSLHNQAVKELGVGLRAVAHDPAGVIQAIELVDRPGVLGVQWHPEYLPVSRSQQRLFRALVQEALSMKR